MEQTKTSKPGLSLGKIIEMIVESKSSDQTLSESYQRDLRIRSESFLEFLKRIKKYNRRPSSFLEANALSYMEGFTSSSTYYNNIRRSMSALFQYGVDREWLEYNPFKDVKIKTQESVKPVTFDVGQMIELLSFIDETGCFQELRICANLVYSSFLLPHQEIRLLKKSDFSSDLTKLTLEGKRNKNSRRRVIKVDEQTTAILIEWGVLDLDSADNIFSKGAKPYSRSYFNNQWRWLSKLDKDLGDDPMSNHIQILKPGQTLISFRHAGAIDFYKVHGDVHALQDLLGHSSIYTTEAYLRSLGLFSD